jgi:hypothetical protein
MTTPFLTRFSAHLVRRLVEQQRLELEEGAEAETALWLARHLAERRNVSLVSEVSRALLSAPGVVELFADDEELKELIVELPPDAARG